MEREKSGPKAVIQRRVSILKRKGYRGFQISNEKDKLKDTIEVGARSKTGLMLIAIGDTLEEAYENLIERIDSTLDG